MTFKEVIDYIEHWRKKLVGLPPAVFAHSNRTGVVDSGPTLISAKKKSPILSDRTRFLGGTSGA